LTERPQAGPARRCPERRRCTHGIWLTSRTDCPRFARQVRMLSYGCG